jgi:hypothetical protein
LLLRIVQERRGPFGLRPQQADGHVDVPRRLAPIIITPQHPLRRGQRVADALARVLVQIRRLIERADDPRDLRAS